MWKNTDKMTEREREVSVPLIYPSTVSAPHLFPHTKVDLMQIIQQQL